MVWPCEYDGMRSAVYFALKIKPTVTLFFWTVWLVETPPLSDFRLNKQSRRVTKTRNQSHVKYVHERAGYFCFSSPTDEILRNGNTEALFIILQLIGNVPRTWECNVAKHEGKYLLTRSSFADLLTRRSSFVDLLTKGAMWYTRLRIISKARISCLLESEYNSNYMRKNWYF